MLSSDYGTSGVMRARIIDVDQNRPDPSVVDEAARVIQSGGTVVFPTETVYGLGADALSEAACRKIFAVKGRPADNPLIVHICSLDQLDEICTDISPSIREAVNHLWPGPVTLILKRTSIVPDAVTAGLATVAIRMPANPLALALIEKSGTPIAAPSANIATRPSIVDSVDAIRELGNSVDMILAAGRTYFGIESTIVNVSVKPYVLLRPGVFSSQDLERFLGRIISDQKNFGTPDSITPMAPGMKYIHYSPRRPLALVTNGDLFRKVPNFNKRVALIGTSQSISGLQGKHISLGDEEDPYEVASNLFKAFRILDDTECIAGFIHPVEETGIGIAVMNRIRKAARAIVSDENELKDFLSSVKDFNQ